MLKIKSHLTAWINVRLLTSFWNIDIRQ